MGYVGQELKKNGRSSPKGEKAMGISVIVFCALGLICSFAGSFTDNHILFFGGLVMFGGVIVVAFIFKLIQKAIANNVRNSEKAETALGIVKYSNFSGSSQTGNTRTGIHTHSVTYKVTVRCGDITSYAFPHTEYKPDDIVKIKINF